MASLAEYEVALRNNGGILTKAAAELGVSRQAVHDRVNNSPELKAVIRDIEEQLLDKCEDAIGRLIDSDDGATVRWYAERKGKARGYGNSTEIGLSRELVDELVAGIGGDLDKLRALRGELED